MSHRGAGIVAGLTVPLHLSASVVGADTRWSLQPGSVEEMVAAIAERHIHGHADGRPSPGEMHRIAASRQVETTCNYVSRGAVRLTRLRGAEARTVATLTLVEWNTTDNGHTLIEAKVGGSWVPFDVDQGVRFIDAHGAPLDLASWVALVPQDAYQVVALEPGTRPEDELRAWYRRVPQVPMISAGDRDWLWSDDEAHVLRYHSSYSALDREEWAARFYP